MRRGLLVVALTLVACGSAHPSRTTDTRSVELPTEAARLEFLSRYLVFPSPVQDAAFHVVYHDNSGGMVPGPSDGDIRAALKVRPADVPEWTAGLVRRDGDDADHVPDWGEALLRDAGWRVRSRPAVYSSANGATLVAVFAPDGIVLKRVVVR